MYQRITNPSQMRQTLVNINTKEYKHKNIQFLIFAKISNSKANNTRGFTYGQKIAFWEPIITYRKKTRSVLENFSPLNLIELKRRIAETYNNYFWLDKINFADNRDSKIFFESIRFKIRFVFKRFWLESPTVKFTRALKSKFHFSTPNLVKDDLK